ncbi:MAG: alpha/beta fold hydrolase [Flavobacteriaceae bacterium]|nr:alpha/beta fold hydrolase [Flavobacteriaceae bacterium]
MKRIITFTIFIFSVLTSFAQDITGDWYGLLKVQGMPLRLVFHVTKAADGYSATMDSPDQGAKDIPVSKTSFENNTVIFEISSAGVVYEGILKDKIVEGTFKQRGQELALSLSREPIEKQALKRPQEPVKPYPYYTEEVTFQNTEANISLAGTLTLPDSKGNFPAVILISGSGPQDRNEEVYGHKPFLVLADHLTRNGIAVLRYDDRGVGKSTGDFKAANTADLATDAESAIAYLKTRKEINKMEIGAIGHSEGGLIAPMLAANSKDLNFIVLLAAPGLRGDKVLLQQQEFFAKASGVSEEEIQRNRGVNAVAFEIILNYKDQKKMEEELSNYLRVVLQNDKKIVLPAGTSLDAYIAGQMNQIASPWMQYFLRYDPVPALEKVQCPVLALYGEKDLQVPPKENSVAVEKAFNTGGNKNVIVKTLPDLNHLFQNCNTGLPKEYGEIEETFSPVALDEITRWIQNQIK